MMSDLPNKMTQNELARRRVLMWFNALSLANITFWSFYMLWIGDPAGIAWTKFASIPFGLAALWIARRGSIWASYAFLTVSLYLTVGSHAWATGLAHIDSAWLILIPVAGYLLGERFVGTVWLGLSAIAILGIYAFGPTETYVFATEGTQAFFALTFLATTSGMSIVFAWILKESIERGRAQMEELEVANEELQRTAAERDEALQRAHQVDKLRSLGLLAGQFAHDYNNLLAVMQTELELALEQEGLDPFVNEGLELALDAAQSSANLTASLLSFSGRAAQSSEPVELGKLLTSVGNLAAAATGRTIRVDLNLASDLVTRGDQSQLEQVFFNIILNAIQATVRAEATTPIVVSSSLVDEDDVSLGRNAIGELEAGPHVAILFEDKGNGMSQEVMSRMFEPFYTSRDGGRGLGLSMVVGTVRAHGGAIDVASSVGEGTSITIYLPIEARLAFDLAASSPMVFAPINGRVAVVDDDDRVRATTTRLLEAHGYEVVAFRDGPTAVDAVSEDPDSFAVAFVDYMMPRMRGDEVIRILAKRAPEVRVVLMSGLVDEALESATLRKESNYVGFLAKPFTIAALTELLASSAENEAASQSVSQSESQVG